MQTKKRQVITDIHQQTCSASVLMSFCLLLFAMQLEMYWKVWFTVRPVLQVLSFWVALEGSIFVYLEKQYYSIQREKHRLGVTVALWSSNFRVAQLYAITELPFIPLGQSFCTELCLDRHGEIIVSHTQQYSICFSKVVNDFSKAQQNPCSSSAGQSLWHSSSKNPGLFVQVQLFSVAMLTIMYTLIWTFVFSCLPHFSTNHDRSTLSANFDVWWISSLNNCKCIDSKYLSNFYTHTHYPPQPSVHPATTLLLMLSRDVCTQCCNMKLSGTLRWLVQHLWPCMCVCVGG